MAIGYFELRAGQVYEMRGGKKRRIVELQNYNGGTLEAIPVGNYRVNVLWDRPEGDTAKPARGVCWAPGFAERARTLITIDQPGPT